MSQRLLVALLTLALLIVGALAGNAGGYPALAAGGTTVTPDYILTLIGQIIAPLGLLFTTLRGLFNAINARVLDGTLQPGDLGGLVTSLEFWTAAVSVVVGVGELFFRVTLFTPETQAIIANSLMAFFTALLNSFAQRPKLSDQSTVELEAVRRRAS